jgi:hypothetical protein
MSIATRLRLSTRLKQAGPMMYKCEQKRDTGLACGRMVKGSYLQDI